MRLRVHLIASDRQTDRLTDRLTDRSTLMAVRLSMDAVQLMTSQAIHVSHSRSPSAHSPLFTCTHR